MHRIGPRKLAKIVHIAFRRWVDFQASPIEPEVPQFAPTEELMEPLELPTPQPSISSFSFSACAGSKATDSEGVVSKVPSPEPFDISDSSSRQNYSGSPSMEQTPHFLLVDDNHINLKVLSTYIRRLGHPYATASDGQEALNAYVANPNKYSCIFMDISMPVMDGFEATQRIRAYERENTLQPVLVFALSGLASTDAQNEAYGSGIDLFLSKPVTLKELGSILRSKKLL